jgi:hypothetical protein
MAPQNDDDDAREGSTKRARLMEPETSNEEHQHQENDHHAVATVQCSVQTFLSVPLPIIFRCLDGGGRRRHKPLMTRTEAQLLLSVTELARELDVLLEFSPQALERQVQSQMIRSDIQDIPTFRSLVPSLVVHGEHIPQQALAHLELELDRVLASCQACASNLKQHSEQNWTMSDSLLDAFGPDDVRGQALAKEKRGLSDLEEELSKRLEHLTNGAAALSKEFIFGEYDQDELSMAALANRMFGVKGSPSTKPAASSSNRTAVASTNAEPTAAATVNAETAVAAVEESKEDLPEEEPPQESPSLLDNDRSIATAAVDESKEDLPDEEMPLEAASPAEKDQAIATTADESNEDPPEEEIPEETYSQPKNARSLAPVVDNDEMDDAAADTSTTYPPEEEMPQASIEPVPEKTRSFAPTAKESASATKPSSQPLAGASMNAVIEIEDDDDDEDEKEDSVAAVMQPSPRKAETARILGSLLSEEQRADTNSDDDQQQDGTDDQDDAFDHHDDEMEDETQALPDSIANTQTAVAALAGLTHLGTNV